MALSIATAEILNGINPDGQKALLGEELLRLGLVQERLLQRPTFFGRVAVLKAADAATRISVLLESELAADRKAYLVGFHAMLGGEIAWSGGSGSKIVIADSGTDLLYQFATIDTESLLPGNLITPTTDGVRMDAEFGRNSGTRLGKGIDIFADGNFDEGSELWITLYGYIA